MSHDKRCACVKEVKTICQTKNPKRELFPKSQQVVLIGARQRLSERGGVRNTEDSW